MNEPTQRPAAEIAELLEKGLRRVELIGARGSYGAYLLSELAAGRSAVAVTPTPAAARRLTRDLRFFLGRSERPNSLLEEPVLLYPERGTSPYTEITPERDLLQRRLAVLFTLAQGLGPRLVVMCMDALQERVIPRAALTAASDFLVAGDTCDREALVGRLVEGGYARVPVVEDAGTFAVRGFILDVFSPLYRYPVRAELNGDEVEALRLFNPDDQRSMGTLREAYFGPVREELYTPQNAQRARRALQERADEAGMPSLALRRLLEAAR